MDLNLMSVSLIQCISTIKGVLRSHTMTQAVNLVTKPPGDHVTAQAGNLVTKPPGNRATAQAGNLVTKPPGNHVMELLLSFITIQPDAGSNAQSCFSFYDMYEVKAIPASLIALVIAFAYGGVLTFVAVYATELHLPLVVDYFFVAMACSSIASRLATGRVYDRFGPHAAIYPAIILISAGLILLGNFHTTVGLLTAGAVIGAGYGMAVPSLQALAVQLSPESRSSAVTATFFTCLDGGIGLGAYLLGGCILAYGYESVYVALGLLTICCSVSYYFVSVGNSKIFL